MTEHDKRYNEVISITWITLFVNVFLSIVKFITGFLGNSSAMVADAVHSLSDTITDIVIIISCKFAEKPADRDHQYGHGKGETFATLIVGAVLFLTSIGIFYSAVLKVFDIFSGGEIVIPGKIALFAAGISILMKELMFRLTISKGRKLGSQALIANAWHQRSDALSSVAALIGIGGAIMLGDKWIFLDPAAAIFTAFLIAKTALPIASQSVNELLETSLGKETEELIIKIIEDIPGVKNPHNMKTRKIGTSVAIDLHIKLPGHLTVYEAHDMSSKVENKLKQRFGEKTFIAIHIDPEDVRTSFH